MPEPLILIAPNAFKESLTAVEAALHIKRGLKRIIPEDRLFVLPVADGGDGSLEVLARALDLSLESIETFDPLGRKILADLGFSENNEAFIEMALSTGLHLLKDEEKNAGESDSYGTGLLLRHAYERKADQINLFVGGTASMDAGTGILRALGFSFMDKNGLEVTKGGIHIGKIVDFNAPGVKWMKIYKRIPLNIFCDVENPMTGDNGSVRVFGPQKDNGNTDMRRLEDSFSEYAGFLGKVTGGNPGKIQGGGAAGAVAAGLSAFLNVKIFMGADKILDLCGFDHYLDKTDVVITGEGKLDEQSIEGKAPVIVAKRAKNRNKKVIFIGGSIPGDPSGSDYELFDAIFSIQPGPVSLKESVANSAKWLERTAWQIGRLLYL